MLTMRFLLPLILVLATCWASDPINEDVPPQPIQEVLEDYRLPDNVEPIEYKIELKPFFDKIENKKFTFEGKCEITLNVKRNTITNNITFHAKELKLGTKEEITLKYSNKNIKIVNIKEDEEKNFVTLILDENITPLMGILTLFIPYTGKLNDELRGFYRSSYQDKNNKKKWLATTHFEPVSARQAFPCWDEPKLKARFTISIIIPDEIENHEAISNMEFVKSNKRTFTFKTTPRMSTYLVAFVVSDFKNLTKNDNFSVWAKPTVEDNAKEFALDYGLEALKQLSTFTNIDYGQKMKKMDQIAIPDFSAGAMENWGLVTYREPRLLYVEGKTTTEDKQAIATIIAHEFSHQWFGNLVTCEWWNHIWLNEGFATFFQYYITDLVIPNLYKDEDWQLMKQFVVKNTQASSFVVDASTKTRPLNPKVNVQTPTQIRSLFDDIAYKKGASILHMMHGFLSDTVFKQGLQHYLSRHAEGSVNPTDLFTDIQEDSRNEKLVKYLPEKTPLTKVMENWVNEPGYPVITVTWAAADRINITQERFFLVKPAKQDKTQWYIPLRFVTEEAPNNIKFNNSWLLPETIGSFDKLDESQWILFNKDQTGYYRVNYDDGNWQRLVAYLNNDYYMNISETNRAQLIDDALNLARAGYLSYNVSLPITLYLKNETDYIPWYAAVRAFDYLDGVLQNETLYHGYVANQIESFANKTNYTGTENGMHVEKLAKVLALNTECKYGVQRCEEFADKKLKEWLEDDKKNLSPDLRSGILCAGLRKAKIETWNKTLAKYKPSKDENEKAAILAGLGCTTSEEIVKTFLKLTLEKDPVIDIFAAMNSICTGNAGSFDILIKFIKENIEQVQKADNENNSKLIALLNKLANKVKTHEQYAELSLLILGQLQETQNTEALTNAIYKLAWIKTYHDDVEKWLQKEFDNQNGGPNQPGSASSIILTSFLLIIPLLLTRF